jgi:hypothetical protein
VERRSALAARRAATRFKIRPVVRPSLVLLGLLLSLSVLLPGVDVTLPLAAFCVALVVNYFLAVRHLRHAQFALSTPPLGRSDQAMNWTVTTEPTDRSLGGWLLIGASRVHRVPLVPGRASTLPVVLDRRGAYSVAQLQLISVGPLFLPLHAGATVHRDLASILVVAPRLLAYEPLLEAVKRARLAGEGELTSGGSVPGGPESVRPFEMGDRISTIHWPATARTGAVHVKQLERLGGSTTITLVVDGVDGSDRGERMLSEATWLVHQLIPMGFGVDLVTAHQRVLVHSLSHADEVLASVEPGIFVGSTGTAASPHLATVRVSDGWWLVEGDRVGPAGEFRHGLGLGVGGGFVPGAMPSGSSGSSGSSGWTISHGPNVRSASSLAAPAALDVPAAATVATK